MDKSKHLGDRPQFLFKAQTRFEEMRDAAIYGRKNGMW